MIAKNIAHQAVLAGFSVLFTTAAELLEDLRSCGRPRPSAARLARYTRPQLLAIDEVGYLSYDSHAADLLYKVVDRRYERPGAGTAHARSCHHQPRLPRLEHRLPQRHLDRHPARQAHPPRRRDPDRGRQLPRPRKPEGSRGAAGRSDEETGRPGTPLPRRRPRDLQLPARNPDRDPAGRDRQLARDLCRRGVPLRTVRVALLLATARRTLRSGPPLPPVRTLHYFLPVDRGSPRAAPRARLRRVPRGQAEAPHATTRRRKAADSSAVSNLHFLMAHSPGRGHGDLEASAVLPSGAEGGIASTTTSRPVPHAGQRSGSLPTMRE